MFPTLETNIEAALKEIISLQDDALFRVVAKVICKAVRYTVFECGGIEPTPHFEWWIKRHSRTLSATDPEREELDELLAFAFMDDNIDDLTPKILKVLGMK
ncbi:hypothetical protein LCGC14_0504090 [marine sediment metagenome]|uniref:Uncharacterized protein n=1 Tax=marine sediment metagenome TaxID=412755 RepID=A0A0F9S844_9ZZZZ